MYLDYVPPSALGVTALAVITTFLFFAAVSTSLRLWAIYLIKRRLKVHDYLVFAGLLLSCVNVTAQFIGVLCAGAGYHVSDLSQEVVGRNLKNYFISNLTWLIPSILVKSSILFLYLDIFKSDRLFRRVVLGIFVLVGMTFSAFLTDILMMCEPIAQWWSPEGTLGHCNDLRKGQIATAGINALIDLAIVVCPVPTVLGLQTSRKKRWRIISMFGLGVVISLINVTRLIFAIRFPESDITFYLIGPAILCSLEVNFGIIVACLPTITPVMRWSHEYIMTVHEKSRLSDKIDSYHHMESTSGSIPIVVQVGREYANMEHVNYGRDQGTGMTARNSLLRSISSPSYISRVV